MIRVGLSLVDTILMYRLYCFVVLALIATSASTYAAQRQKYSSNRLCDDYVRLKLQEYLDGYEAVSYDDYIAYKDQLTQFCEESLTNNNPLPRDRNALRSFSRSLD